jgi:tetratricopeptide (TPR) repeat protein
MNKKRLLIFKGLAILSPLILLALLECGLRLFGYGHDLSLFVEDERHPGYLVMNQYASIKYFSDQENATIGNFEPFKKQKTPGTLRIFVLGESTTIGYPYMHNGSFHRWLRYRLMHTLPDKEFEIINLSLTAVNSHTVFDFGRQLASYEPDAVLIYTGHNEYYGALGAGSTKAFARNTALIRTVIKLREFRVIQLIYGTLTSIKAVLAGKEIDLRENLMKRMAEDQQIAYGSDTYQAGIDQFKTNMNDLCDLMNKQNIPVFISNLVGNEKDLKPFISKPGKGAQSAQFHFDNANRLYAGENFTQAKNEYVQASELDLLRFRAPRAINRIIREIADTYPGVTLVDVRAAFEKNSEHGILGKQTLLEHVHPNLLGYALISDAFYESLEKSGLISVKNDHTMSFAELRKRMPVTLVDSLKGDYEVMILKEGWPFNMPMPQEEKRKKTIEEQLAGALVVKQISWEEAMGRLKANYISQNDKAGALKVMEALALEQPLDPLLYDQTSSFCLSIGENEKAITYLSHAFRIENNFDRAQKLFIALLKLDRPQEALAYLGYAATNNQSGFSLNELHSFVQELVILKSKFEKDSTNVTLTNQLAAGYLKFANAAAADKYVELTLKREPKNQVALQLKEQIKAIHKTSARHP